MYKDFDVNKIFHTSSFGTTAALLLKMVPNINQKIFFLNTTYHFQETINYKDQLKEKINLKIDKVLTESWENDFTKSDITWRKDTDLCWSINKFEPMDRLKEDQDVWISGLLKYQNSHRKELNVFEEKSGIIKFYPILNMTNENVVYFFVDNNIPKYTLKAQGYSSIDCAKCTIKGQGRAGRRNSYGKTECGLHL